MEERILLDGQQEADRVIARAKREAELKKTKLMEEVRHDMIMAAIYHSMQAGSRNS